MAFDDLAFSSSYPSGEERKVWCPLCFQMFHLSAGDSSCPSCCGPVRDISDADATSAATLLQRVQAALVRAHAGEGSAGGATGAAGGDGGSGGGDGAALAGLGTLFGPMGLALAGLQQLATLGTPAAAAAASAGGAAGAGASATDATAAGSGASAAGTAASVGDGLGTAAEIGAVSDEDLPALLERLMEEFGGSHGKPAASSAVVDALPTIEVEGVEALPREVALHVSGMPGQLVTIPAGFGPAVPREPIDAPIVLADPPMFDVPTADVSNAGDIRGAVLMVDRGKIGFADKARMAQELGAVALIVGQNCSVWPYTMTDSKTNGEGVDIPVVMVQQGHGERLRAMLKARQDEAAAAAADAGSTAEAEAGAAKPPAEGDAGGAAATAGSATSAGAGDGREALRLRWLRRGVRAQLQSKSSSNTCVVCQEDYERGDKVTQMPCQHLFHSACLKQWLKSNNTCCICRMELKTDDADYEAARRRELEEGSGQAQWSAWYGCRVDASGTEQ